MSHSRKTLLVIAALGLCFGSMTVTAQNMGGMAPASSSSSMGHMGMGKGMMHNKMKPMNNGSMHKMPATVTSVDTSSGIVELTSAGMSLRVHFPPASVAKLKAGDKITLHMGYTQ